MTYEGIDGLMHRLPMNAFNGSEECYCTRETKNLDGQEECLPEGLIDLHTCFRKFLKLVKCLFFNFLHPTAFFLLICITYFDIWILIIFGKPEAPVTLSHPHLIGVDERYLQTINGLSPDVQKHLSFVEIEPVRFTFP